MRILIADDEALARLVLKTVLEDLGHEVLEAKDGRQAWEIYHEEDVRMLVLDWIMPELSGLEVCRMVRAENRPAYTYVVMLTVLEGKGSYLEAMDAGVDDFVHKPLDPAALAGRLRVADRILGLQAEVTTLQGLLPICSYCKKIRDESDAWHDLDQYVAQRTDAAFSHGICPNCYDTQVERDLQQLRKTGS